ncbi:MAG: phage terminase large subunit, partial [Candidatus Omnitrophica bacterium]|nr:phage terminase large subunit [Candidatus Omnitrophota bacterium]
LVKRWRPRMVGIEKVAYQRALVHFLMKEMPKRNMFFPVFELAAEKQKELRIKALQPRFKAHTVWLPEHAPWLTEMESELLMFPKGLHDDLIDAMAYIPAFAFAKNPREVAVDSLNRIGIPVGNAGLEFANAGMKYDPMGVLHGPR